MCGLRSRLAWLLLWHGLALRRRLVSLTLRWLWICLALPWLRICFALRLRNCLPLRLWSCLSLRRLLSRLALLLHFSICCPQSRWSFYVVIGR